MAMKMEALKAVARAIKELDKGSFARPTAGIDEAEWLGARSHLFNMLKSNGYELCAPGSARLRKIGKNVPA